VQRRHRPGFLATALVAAVAAASVLVTACTVPAAGAPTGSAAPSGTPDATAPTGGSPSASPPTRPFKPTPAPAPTFATYTVRRGDTLITLASRFETTPESLAYWNRARYPSLDPESRAYRPERIETGWQLVYIPGAVVDPENLPPASAAPTDGVEPGSGPVGPYPTLPADGGAALVRRGPAGLDAVALTFEYAGGPGAGPGGAEAIVQWLEANGVPATIFVGPGEAATVDPTGVAVLGRLRTARSVRAGLLAGLENAGGLAAALHAADRALSALGTTTAPWLRPAGGVASPAALLAAGRAGWPWAVSWDVDPGDGVEPAAGGPIATDIATRVVSRAGGGSIIRLQLGGAHTLEALPGILDGLASAGLRVVSLDELLGLSTGH
jgi:peptidoglycan/xylan/chitin deacetylase (PgdA/CDA1 family)